MERLKELRKQAHLTQVELAGKLGVVQSSYADWERGKNDTRKFSQIAQVLKWSVDYLVGNSGENSNELDNIGLLFLYEFKRYDWWRKKVRFVKRANWVYGGTEISFW